MNWLGWMRNVGCLVSVVVLGGNWLAVLNIVRIVILVVRLIATLFDWIGGRHLIFVI